MNRVVPYGFGEIFVGGKWQNGGSGKDVPVYNPWSGSTVSVITAADRNDVDLAYAAAEAAQPVWAATLPVERASFCARVGQIMERRKNEIVDWLVQEAGSTITKAGIEWWAVHNSVMEAATLPTRTVGRILYGDYADKENRIYRRPIGVVGVISPWNWPMHLSMRSVIPAIALGNAVVIKPSLDTPITGGLLIAKIFEEAGLPPGVLNVVAGQSAEIGDCFTSHAIPRVMSFTGSTEIGRHIGALAVTGPRIKRVMLELGGNGPLIVTEDVDLDFAVHTAVVGKLFHQGQMCIAVNRIIVAQAIHDAFVEKFVERARALTYEDRDNRETAYGPIINRAQLDRILGLIESAKAEGARLRLGGDVRGLLLPVHVFDGVTTGMRIAQQEIFGPVATILTAVDDDDAIRIANDTEYGLTSGVLCRDEGRALRIAKQIHAGMTHINDIPAIDMPQMPFGGEKNSGLSRFGSPGMIDMFTREHWISVQHSEPQYPF